MTEGTLSHRRDIKPSKSYCYVAAYKWTAGQWGYKTIREAPVEFKIYDTNDRMVTIDRHEHTHSEKALGYLQAPDGNMKAELKAILKKSIKWTNNICNSSLNRWMIWQGLHSTI